MIDFSPRTDALLLACGLNLLLAAYTWWRYGHQRLLRHFALFATGMAAYILFLAGLAGLTQEADAVLWIRGAAALSYLLHLSFFRFAMVFGRAETRWPKRIFSVGLGLALADSLARFSGLVPVKLLQVPGQGWFPAGPDLVYFLCYLPTMLLLVLGGLVLIGRRRKAASGLEASQLNYVFLAVAAALAMSLFNLVPRLAMLATLSPVAFTAVIGYAVTRRRLLEIRVLLREGAIVAGLGLLLGFSAALLLLLSRQAWGGGPAADWFSAVTAALLFSLGFDPLRRLLKAAADRLFKLRPLEPSERLVEYSLLATAHRGFEDFLQAVAEKLSADFGLLSAGVLLADVEGRLQPRAQVPRGSLPSGVSLDGAGPAARQLLGASFGVDVDSLAWTQAYELDPTTDADEGAELRSFLLQASAQAAFPLSEGARLSGCLIVGAPRSGAVFSGEELAFFTALAHLLAQAWSRQRLQGAVEQADRLSALGTLAASLTHEIRNPLASISAFMQMLPKRHADTAFIERFGRVVGGEVEKLQKLSEDMLDFARPGHKAGRAVDLGALAERHRQLMAYQFSRRRVRLKVEAQRGVWVGGSESELAQVLLNLLLNALEVSPDGAEVALSVRAEGGEARMAVADAGPGISAGARERLFEPFFTTKAEGTGLGLALCRKIVEGAGGRIQADPAAGGGSVFSVSLPLLQPEGTP